MDSLNFGDDAAWSLCDNHYLFSFLLIRKNMFMIWKKKVNRNWMFCFSWLKVRILERCVWFSSKNSTWIQIPLIEIARDIRLELNPGTLRFLSQITYELTCSRFNVLFQNLINYGSAFRVWLVGYVSIATFKP